MLTPFETMERDAQAYVAVRREVTIPFGDEVGPIMGELFGKLEAAGLQPDGPVFFKYNIIDMPRLEIEFAVPVATPVSAEGLVAGMVPAGRYVTTTYTGDYDGLIDATAALLGWTREQGIVLDSTMQPDGEHFASRLEVYHNGPEDEPDPAKWRTTLAMKIR